MKQIFKYAMMLLTAGVVFAACTDDDAVRRATVSGAQVFFNNELPEVMELSKSESSFTVPVVRANTSGAITVPITVEAPEGSIYNVPSSVTFADGDTIANIVVTYDPNQLNYGSYTDLTIQIADSTYTTPYGDTRYSFSAGATEWERMAGMATYREALVPDWGFGASITPITYQVPIERNVVREGVYRLVNPYGAWYPFNAPGDYDATKNSYMVIDASDPEYVWVEKTETNMDWGYGIFTWYSRVAFFLERGNELSALKNGMAEYFGIMEDGVITMPANSFLGSMANYQDGSIFAGFNTEGLFAVALPGARISDYNLSYQYLGRFIDDNNKNQVYARGVASLGSDIAAAKAALATEENYQEVYEQIVAGEAGIDIASGQEFYLPFEGSGTYYVLIVGFDADGEVVQTITPQVKLTDPNDAQPAPVNWIPQYVGDYYYYVFSSEEEDEIDEGLTLSYDEDNESHYQIAPWGNESTLELYINDDNTITVPADQPSGVTIASGELMVADVQTFTGGAAEYADYVSTLNQGVFTLYLVYYNNEKSYLSADTFTITGVAEDGVKKFTKTSHKVIGEIKANGKTRNMPVLAKDRKFIAQ